MYVLLVLEKLLHDTETNRLGIHKTSDNSLHGRHIHVRYKELIAICRSFVSSHGICCHESSVKTLINMTIMFKCRSISK